MASATARPYAAMRDKPRRCGSAIRRPPRSRARFLRQLPSMRLEAAGARVEVDDLDFGRARTMRAQPGLAQPGLEPGQLRGMGIRLLTAQADRAGGATCAHRGVQQSEL